MFPIFLLAEITMSNENLIRLQNRVESEPAFQRAQQFCPFSVVVSTRFIADNDALRFHFWLIDRKELHLCEPLLCHLVDLARPADMKTLTLEAQRFHLYNQSPSLCTAWICLLRSMNLFGESDFSLLPRDVIDKSFVTLFALPGIRAPNCVLLMFAYRNDKGVRKALCLFGVWPEDRSVIQWLCIQIPK